MQHKAVIFGEMLWDCLPSGPVPGGAPMNVTLNLHQLGLDSRLISAVGKDTEGQQLLKLLHHKTLRVFDVNFRPPFYDFEIIETLLGFTDILKINEDELDIFADYFDVEPSVKSVCSHLDQHYPMDLICVTQGSKGALIYKDGHITSHEGYKVKVADSIGAGDAFLSGFIKTYLENQPLDQVLDFACKLGAFVASKKGGTPRYEVSDL